ncbi:ClpP/crotonase-like domain-containing protein [Exophiala viscosa]|uniref:ClpP/crotonase-like domain-containing protein n=1 Tax=Exophiala viscosa TaxID=2486360 RepID=A0AAN6IA32_9EURO|nr:ClpP/crotonase-like domain-containing protein [Exophiala viscosa]KAI1620566.1 ClpP/crotonase-like domain-containing protein [Exophiala viscosa]
MRSIRVPSVRRISSFLARPSVSVLPRTAQCYFLARESQPTQQRHFTKTTRCRQVASPPKPQEENEGEGQPRIGCTITTQPDGSETAKIYIANEARLNSLGSNLLQTLKKTCHDLSSREKLRVVVFTSARTIDTKIPAFCAGANIREMAALTSQDEARKFITGIRDACQALRDIPVVTIARIHGLCFGAGLELAASCDFRYATSDSRFSMPEVVLGIPSVVQARLLANIIGWQKTKELVYMGTHLDGAAAAQCGLIDQGYKGPGELDAALDEIVGNLVSQGPQAMRAQKRLVRLWEESDLQIGVDAGVDSFASMWKDGGSEPKEYMKRFTERQRKPKS